MQKPASAESAFTYKSIFTYNSNVDTTMYKSRNCYKSAFGYTYQSLPSSSEKNLSGSSDQRSWPLIMSRSVIICCCYIFLVALFPVTLLFCLKKIHALERLVILRLGKVLPVVGPGYYIILPFIDTYSKVDLKPKLFHIPVQQILISDGAIIEVLASIKYCVSHAVHYVTKLKSQEKAIHELLQRCFTNLVSEKEQRDLQQDRMLISSSVKMELNSTLLQWGVEILDIVMPPIKVLKEAEPVNVLAQIMNAFEVTQKNNSSAVPGLYEFVNQGERSSPEIHKSITIDFNDTILTKITDLVQLASKNNSFQGISAVYKLQISGAVDRIIFVQVEEGIASIPEKKDLCASVTITLTTEDIVDCLESKASPVDAYMEGRIKVVGDASLLKHLFQALTLQC